MIPNEKPSFWAKETTFNIIQLLKDAGFSASIFAKQEGMVYKFSVLQCSTVFYHYQISLFNRKMAMLKRKPMETLDRIGEKTRWVLDHAISAGGKQISS